LKRVKKACSGDSWKTLYEPFGRACEKARKERANCQTSVNPVNEESTVESSPIKLLESVARPDLRGEIAWQCCIQEQSTEEFDAPFFNHSIACGPLFCYFSRNRNNRSSEWAPYWVSMSGDSLFVWRNYKEYESTCKQILISNTSHAPIFEVQLASVSVLMGTGSSHLSDELKFPTSYSFRIIEKRDTGNADMIPVISFCANSFDTLNRWCSLLSRRLAVSIVNVDELVSLPRISTSSSIPQSGQPLSPSISGRVGDTQRSTNNSLPSSQSPTYNSPSFVVSPESAHRETNDDRFVNEPERNNAEQEKKRLEFLNNSDYRRSVNALNEIGNDEQNERVAPPTSLPKSFFPSVPSFSFPSALPLMEVSTSSTSSSSSFYNGIFARKLSITEAVGRVSDIEVGIGASAHSVKTDVKVSRETVPDEKSNHSGSNIQHATDFHPSRLTSDTESSRSRTAARKADEESKAREREAAIAAELAMVASLKAPVHGMTVPIVTVEKNPRLYALPTRISRDERRNNQSSHSYSQSHKEKTATVLHQSNAYSINTGNGGMRDFVKRSTTYQNGRSSDTPSLLDRTIELGEKATARRVRSPDAARGYSQSRMDTFHKSLGVNVPSSSLNSFQYTSGYERPGWKKAALGADIIAPSPYDPFDLFSDEFEERTGGGNNSFNSDISSSVLTGPTFVVGSGAPKAFGIVAAPTPLPYMISSSINSGNVEGSKIFASSSSVIGVPRLYPRRNSLISTESSIELRALSPGIKRKVMWAGQHWPAAEATLLLNSLSSVDAKENELMLTSESTKTQPRKSKQCIDADGSDDYDAEVENENGLRQKIAPKPMSMSISLNSEESKEVNENDVFDPNAPLSLLIEHIADVEARLKKSEGEKEVMKGLLEVSLNGMISPQSSLSSMSTVQPAVQDLNNSGVVERVLDSPLEVSSRLAMMMTAARNVRETLTPASSTSFSLGRENDTRLSNTANTGTISFLPSARGTMPALDGEINSSILDSSKGNLLSSSLLSHRVNESLPPPQSTTKQPYNPFNSPEKATPSNSMTNSVRSVLDRSTSGPLNLIVPPLLSSSASISSSPRTNLVTITRINPLLASYVYLIGGGTQLTERSTSTSGSGFTTSSANGFKTSRTSIEINADICPSSLVTAIRAFAINSTSIDTPTSLSTSSLGRVYNVTRVFKADPFAFSDAITTRRISAMLLNKHNSESGNRTLLLTTVLDCNVDGGEGSTVSTLSQAMSLIFGSGSNSSNSVFFDVLSGTMLASGGSVKFTVRAVSVTTSSGQTGAESGVLADLLLPVLHRNNSRPPSVSYTDQFADVPEAAVITGAAGVVLSSASDCTRFCSLVKKRIEGSLSGGNNESSNPADLAIVIAELESGASFSIAIQLCRPEGRGTLPSVSSSLCSKLIQRDTIISLVVV
jgi:hypothetical protein